MAGKAGTLCKTVSLLYVCHFTAMLLIKSASPQSRWLEQVSASGFSLVLQLCHQKGNPPFFSPCPSANFISTQVVSNLIPLTEGKKMLNFPELSWASASVTLYFNTFSDSETFWKASLYT